MPDFAQLVNKMSDPIFAVTLLEFLVALGLWVQSLVKKTNRRRFWFIITMITFIIFLGALENPYLGK
ncbi:MAG: hypothetical protein ACYC4H_08580 [Desulfocucumaceae bacterium]